MIQSFRQSSLRARLMLLVGLAVLPALGLVLYSSRIQQRLEHRAAQENTLRLARLAASNQDRLVEGARQLLTAFVQVPEIRIGNPGACSALLAHLLRQFPRYANFGVADARGQIFCSGLPIDRPVDASARSWFQRSLTAKGFAAGDYQIGTITHKATINFADALLDDTGRVERVIFVALDLSWVAQFGAQIDLPLGTTLTVLDRNGTILARYPDPEKWTGATIPEAAVPETSLVQTSALRKGEGFVEAPGVDGVERIYAIVPLGDTGGQVRAGIPTAAAYTSVHSGLISDVTALMLAASLALAVVWFGGGAFILRGVNHLVGATRRLASGDLGSRAGQIRGPAEIAQLATAFDQMADALEQREAQRTEAVQVLQDSEQRFRLMFAGNPLPMWVYDLKTFQFLEVNDAAISHYGYSRQEFLAMRITDIRPPEEVPRLLQDLAKDRPSLQRSGEWRHRRKNGDVIEVQIDSHRFALDGREVVLVVSTDITDRKRAEQKLRASEGQISLIYHNVSDIIFHLAVEPEDRFRFLSVNEAFFTATGLTESQVVGKLVHEVIPEPSLALVVGNYKKAIREKRTARWEEVSVYPAGKKYGEVSVTPVFDTEGNCTHLVGAVHDVTERKRAEEEVRKLNEELEERVRQRTAELEAVNKELEAFSYSVAHDLRAPLRAMDGFSRMVVEDFASRLPQEGQRYLHLIRDNAQQMGHLIDDLLTFSRLGRQAVNRQPVNTATLVRQVIQDLRHEHEGRAVTFAVGDLPDCSADPALLKQVFANLLSNALKFTRRRDEPRVEVSSHMDGGQPVYSVKDNGVGFDMQYAGKLFGVFQRLHRAEEYEGTGVGLAIVQRIVRRHGGRVWAEAVVDKGATFHFTLGGAPA